MPFGVGCDGFVHHLDNNVVAHQAAFVHNALDTLAELGLIGNFLAEKVAGRYMGEAVMLNYEVALGAFAGTGSTEYHYVLHFTLTISRSNTRGEKGGIWRPAPCEP